jgi:predicted O-methyltransferase YrrM
MRERVFLYSLVYSVAPRFVLEIGTYKGGSAYIISGALDDLQLGGKLVSIDPHPEQIDMDWSQIAHNSLSVCGLFPSDLDRVRLPDGALYDLAFVDGDHSYTGLLADLRALPLILSPEAYVLLHDAYNGGVERAVADAVLSGWYHDCGRIGRVKNDTLTELYGGLHLLRRAMR